MAGAGADAPKARLRVRAATATLIKPGATDLPTIVKCMREIDTALRAPSPADRDDAAAEFCEGPEGDAERSALRWCAAALHRGIPEALHPGDVKAATFTVGVALQILISVSGADHAQQFGHVTRSGAHEAWPRRGRALIAQRWTPDMWTPTGILPPLLRLARAQAAGAQIRLRALQLAGSVARDAAAREEMVAGGWLDVAWRALEHRPRPDHTESETKEFIYTRETWQFLRETLPAPPPEKIFFSDAESDPGADPMDPIEETEKEKAARLALATSDDAARGIGHRVATEVGERFPATEEDFARGETEWYGRMVRLRGLKARPDLNGSLAFAQGPGGSADRVAVLANPLGVASRSASVSASASHEKERSQGPPEVLSVRRACLAVFESPGLGLGDLARGAPGGAASVAAGAAAETDASFFLDETAEETGARLKAQTNGTNATENASTSSSSTRSHHGSILGALAEADARRDARDWDGALAACEDAARAAAETCDTKSFARAFVMRRTFECFSDAAEAHAAAGDLDASSNARLGALRCAEQAMDLLEFRALAKLRDGRQGERPTSSLSEFTEDETRFVRALVAAGRAEDVRNHFAGASLAVGFARDAFAPALAGALIRKSERREPTAEDAPDARDVLERAGPTDSGDPDPDRRVPVVSESACWRRLSFALRAVDAQRKLGALAVTWRPRGVVGEAPGDAAGPGESLGATRAAGYAAPSALPAGTHRAFRKARGAFLRTYLDLLIARFAARRRGISEEGGGTPNDTNDANETVPPRVAAAGAALRVEPLMLQFSVGAFGDLMAEDEAFAAAEADEETREARRARSAEANGETND